MYTTSRMTSMPARWSSRTIVWNSTVASARANRFMGAKKATVEYPQYCDRRCFVTGLINDHSVSLNSITGSSSTQLTPSARR